MILRVVFLLLISQWTHAGSLIITSDIHISGDEGRFTEKNQEFQTLLDENCGVNDYFIVGDVVDNVLDNPIRVGSVDYRNSEFDIFNAMMGDKTFNYSYGVGHDFGAGENNLIDAVEYTGMPSRGVMGWGQVNLIWLTPIVGSFPSLDGITRQAFSDDDIAWLNQTLSDKKNFILMFHVPLRATGWQSAYYQTPDGREYAIPLADHIYQAIESNKESLIAIIAGHVHISFSSVVSGVPYYMFAFDEGGCHAKLTQKLSLLNIKSRDCNNQIENDIDLNTPFIIPITNLILD